MSSKPSSQGGRPGEAPVLLAATQHNDGHANHFGVLIVPTGQGATPEVGHIIAPTNICRTIVYPARERGVMLRTSVDLSLTIIDAQTYNMDWRSLPLPDRVGVALKFKRVDGPVESRGQENMFAEIMTLNHDRREMPNQVIHGSIVVARKDDKWLSTQDVVALWEYVHALVGAGRHQYSSLLPSYKYSGMPYDVENLERSSDTECWVRDREDLLDKIREIWVGKEEFSSWWNLWQQLHLNEGHEGYSLLECPVSFESRCEIQ